MTTWLFAADPPPPGAAAGSSIRPPLDRVALEQIERAERRRVAREEMRSSHSSAAEKIRAWERLHGLQLPGDPTHIVLHFIARRTGLTLDAVLDEQRIRAGR